jgi:hypothetical protein
MTDVKNDLSREIGGLKDGIKSAVDEVKDELTKAKEMMAANLTGLKQGARGVQNLASALGELKSEFDEFFGTNSGAFDMSESEAAPLEKKDG